ncbi:M61 family metallopeptidase [Luteibaculum oceani]|uniref:Peptidase M61 n=1 Tax=Luteibaculum oceani TaxID=1294296 RepID=A0A5C6VI26_9FLAO|nr:peptidase M61 [Luteibaculum oceani]TXC85082.1 peptidase M61 [Luteibaculum oceani]
MKKLIFLFSLCAMCLSSFSQGVEKYRVKLDLSNVVNDELEVEITVPKVTKDVVEFQMPKIVPGTYSISDFGRFITRLDAYDTTGNPIAIKKLGVNRWEIRNAQRLKTFRYRIEDSFDTKLDNVIFEPAGTNFEEGKNFVLNNFGIIGYLSDMKNYPYEVEIRKPKKLYGASSLPQKMISPDKDIWLAKDYFHLHDNPIMYCEPDTATIPVGNCEVLISVYSPNKILTADAVKENVGATLEAQRKYLGGILPVDKYAILIYLFDGASLSGSAGALEHSTSTVFSFPEGDPEQLASSIRDVTAHEFFHIVTPLNIHSEQIHNYNFIEPKMSKHLWMYEGCTEYAAQHVQVKYDLMSEEDFLDVMRQKMLVASVYNDTLPFTKMSKHVLDKYENQYGNVYQKGALIGMCLDILLLEKSNGEMDLQQLMRTLAKEYGAHKPFEDEKLFEIIGEKTYPEIQAFLETYVGGPAQLPFAEILNKVGVEYAAEKEVSKITFGGISLGYNIEKQLIQVNGLDNANDFAKKIGFKTGDLLYKLNGEELTPTAFQDVYNRFVKETQEGDKIEITVLRKKKDDFKEKTLKAKAQKVNTMERHYVKMMENPSEEQLKLRKAWLTAKE